MDVRAPLGDHMLTDDDLQAALGGDPGRRARACRGGYRFHERDGGRAGRGRRRPSGPWYPLRTRPRDAGGSAGRGPTCPTGRCCSRSCSGPSLPPARAGLLSLLAGACMAEAIRDVAGRSVSCKWPNDLMLHDEKVGGILLESGGRRRRPALRRRRDRGEPARRRTASPGAGGARRARRPARAAHRVPRSGSRAIYRRPTRRCRSGCATPGCRCPPRSARSCARRRATASESTGRAVGIDDFGSLQLSTDTGEAARRVRRRRAPPAVRLTDRTFARARVAR